MSKKKEEYARLMRRNIEYNVHERKTYNKMAVDSLSGADKALDKEILDKKREIIEDTFSGRGGRKVCKQHSQWNKARAHQRIQGYQSTSKGQSPFAIFILLFIFLLRAPSAKYNRQTSDHRCRLERG